MKKNVQQNEKWVPESQAVKVLGVHFNTVKRWIKTGRLKHKLIKGQRFKNVLVLRSSLAKAFKAKCVICGKVFTAKHPEKAKFCCLKHKSKWFNGIVKRLNAEKKLRAG